MALWNEFLQQQKSGFATASQTTLCPIDHKAILAITGPDSKKFLQGQVSCDINQVNDNSWLRGAHCNHKGRTIFDFMAAQQQADQILLLCHNSVAATAKASLAKYIVFSKAEISVDEHLCAFGLAGENAQTLLADIFPTAEPQQSMPYQSGFILCLNSERFEIWLPANEAIELWQTLKPSCQQGAAQHWRLLDIHAGIGEVQQTTSEMFIPQMLNLNELGGINYQKGCYTGQEIIARMQYRGNLKRHMYHLSNPSLQTAEAGNDIHCADKDQSIGNIVSAEFDDGTLHVLAVCIDDKITDSTLFLKEKKEHIFSVESLPYAITKVQDS